MNKFQGKSFRLVLLGILIAVAMCNDVKGVRLSADNVCTFHIVDRLFSLIYLQGVDPYVMDINANEKVKFNFCHSFVPTECQTNKSAPDAQGNKTAQQPQLLQAFAYHIIKSTTTTANPTTNKPQQSISYTCTPYTSNSYLYYFTKDYLKHNDQPQLVLNLTTTDEKKATEFRVFCSDQEYFKQKSVKFENNGSRLVIRGESAYGCPVFQISSLWTTLEEHQLILGVILFLLGFQLLFYGLMMINVTVFIAGYFISFAIYGGIFTVFLGPDSSSIAVYFSLLFILLASTLTAYGLTRLINLSIFFIGAFLGLILGALVNTIFTSIFSIHSVWSLVIFEILFTIPFGLMTLKYSNQIIILSTSLTGSYLIIRPISWIIGGFPNEFTLYQMFESRQLSSVPWAFYFYLLLIIINAIMGAFYQHLKLQRQQQNSTIMTNIVTENIEQPLDKIKETVDKLIARYSSHHGDEDYKKMKEMDYSHQYFEENINPGTQYNQIDSVKERKSKERNSKDRNSKEENPKEGNPKDRKSKNQDFF